MRLLIACAVLISPSIAAEPGGREFSVIVDGREKEYTVEVGGTVNPENLEIVFENIGNTPLKNPRMTVGGLYDCYQLSPDDRSALHPVRAMNGYGYGIFRFTTPLASR